MLNLTFLNLERIKEKIMSPLLLPKMIFDILNDKDMVPWRSSLFKHK